MHEKNRGYNGWSNYETWNFKLWLDNDESVHNYIINGIKKIKAIGYDAEAYEVSNFLRSYIDDNMPNLNVQLLRYKPRRFLVIHFFSTDFQNKPSFFHCRDLSICESR